MPTFKHKCDNVHVVRQTQFNFNDCRTIIFRFDRVDGVDPKIYHSQKILPDDSILLNDLYFAQLNSFVIHNNDHYVCGVIINEGNDLVLHDDLTDEAQVMKIDKFLDTEGYPISNEYMHFDKKK